MESSRDPQGCQHPCHSLVHDMHHVKTWKWLPVAVMRKKTDLPPDRHTLDAFSAGVLCHQAHAPSRCTSFGSTCCHIFAGALATAIACPAYVAILKWCFWR